MSDLADIMDQPLRTLVGGAKNNNPASALPVLAINAAAAATWRTTAAIQSIFDGLHTTRVALAAQAFAANAVQQQRVNGQSGFITVPATRTCFFAFAVNAAGTPFVIQGTPTGLPFYQNGVARIGDGFFPDVGEELALFGGLKVVCGVNPFIPNTTALDAATFTNTFRDMAMKPAADVPF